MSGQKGFLRKEYAISIFSTMFGINTSKGTHFKTAEWNSGTVQVRLNC